MIANHDEKCQADSGNTKSSELICGDLTLTRVSYVPELGDEPAAVLVECRVGARAMRLKMHPAAIGSFGAFRKICLRRFGVLPRSSRIEDTRPSKRAEEWNTMVEDASLARQEAGR